MEGLSRRPAFAGRETDAETRTRHAADDAHDEKSPALSSLVLGEGVRLLPNGWPLSCGRA
jgi:hypothetical protein